MVEWTQEAIRFRMDAAERVGFDETIAAQILPHLPQTPTCAMRAAALAI